MIFPQTTSKALRSIEVGFFFHPTFTWVCSKMGDAPERAILEKWMDHHGSTMKCWHFMGISNSFPTKKNIKNPPHSLRFHSNTLVSSRTWTPWHFPQRVSITAPWQDKLVPAMAAKRRMKMSWVRCRAGPCRSHPMSHGGEKLGIYHLVI